MLYLPLGVFSLDFFSFNYYISLCFIHDCEFRIKKKEDTGI